MEEKMFRGFLALAIGIGLIVKGCKSEAKDTWELMGPGVSYHVIDGGASYLYDHKVSDDGRWIYTPTIGLRKTHINRDSSYMSFTGFKSNNSIGSPIYGAMGGLGFQAFGDLNIGLACGGYIQNNEDFRYKGIVPFSATGGTNAFVPLLGFEINWQIPLTDRTFIGVNNLITPIITNHSLSLGYSY